MAAPFYSSCENLEYAEGVFSCEAFPRGIPVAVYPWGCLLRAWFRPKVGMEEIARRWLAVSQSHEDKTGERS